MHTYSKPLVFEGREMVLTVPVLIMAYILHFIYNLSWAFRDEFHNVSKTEGRGHFGLVADPAGVLVASFPVVIF